MCPIFRGNGTHEVHIASSFVFVSFGKHHLPVKVVVDFIIHSSRMVSRIGNGGRGKRFDMLGTERQTTNRIKYGLSIDRGSATANSTNERVDWATRSTICADIKLQVLQKCKIGIKTGIGSEYAGIICYDSAISHEGRGKWKRFVREGFVSRIVLESELV